MNVSTVMYETCVTVDIFLYMMCLNNECLLSCLSSSAQKSELKPLNCSSRLMSLFTSPQVKFYWNIASYFGFLWLFAVVLMIDFQDYPSWRELLLYVWLTSLVVRRLDR